MDNYRWEHETIYKYVREEGLNKSESAYIVNKVSNAVWKKLKKLKSNIT